MRNFLALFGTLLLGVSSAQAEDVTSTYISNADFSEGTVVSTIVRTYDYNVADGEDGSGLLSVTGWTASNTAEGNDMVNTLAGGLFAYGSSAQLGSDGNTCPTTNPDGEASGNALGIVAVWGGQPHYTTEALAELPAGTYTVTFKVYCLKGTSALSANYFGFVEEGGTTHYGTTTQFTVGAWQDETVKFTLTEATKGSFSIGLSYGGGSGAAQHLFIDNVKVEYDASASEAEMAELNEAIAAAEAHTLGFGVGEYAPYNNVAALQTLASAKQAATSADVAEALSALSAATWTANTEELDAIYDGSLSQKTVSVNSGEADDEMVKGGWTSAVGYRLILGDEEKYPALSQTTAGRAVFVWNGTAVKYGETTGYTMPLTANTVYELSLKHCGWNDGIKGIGVSVLNADNEGLQSVTTEAAASTPSTAGAFVSSTYYFKTGTASDYILSIAPNTGNATLADFSLVKAQAGTVSITEGGANADGSAYYATCATTTPVNLDECGFSAYGLTVEGTSITYAQLSGTVPAGTPLLVNAASAGDYEAVVGLTADAASVTTALQVSDGTVQGDEETIYVLSNENNQLGWYLLESGVTIAAGKCYLKIEESTGAKFIGFDGMADAISGVAKSQSASAARYNLGGQRVDGSYKGIVIVNGKKYLNK